MSTKLTHKDKDLIINKLSAEVAAQRAEISALRVQIEHSNKLLADREAAYSALCAETPKTDERTAQKYPFVDGLGRRYRIEQRGGRAPIKCFAPSA